MEPEFKPVMDVTSAATTVTQETTSVVAQASARPANYKPEREGPAWGTPASTWTRPPTDEERCTGHLKNGERCSKYAIKGGKVCPTHGGSAKQVKKSAREKLDLLVDPAIRALADVLKDRAEHKDIPSVVRTAVAILDRCGFHPTQTVEMSGGVGVNVNVSVVQGLNLDALTVEQKQTLIELLEIAGVVPVDGGVDGSKQHINSRRLTQTIDVKSVGSGDTQTTTDNNISGQTMDTMDDTKET